MRLVTIRVGDLSLATGALVLAGMIAWSVLDQQSALDREWRAWIELRDIVLEQPLAVGRPARIGLVYAKRGRQPALGLTLETKFRQFSLADMTGTSRSRLAGENDACDSMNIATGPLVTSTGGILGRYTWPITTPFNISHDMMEGKATFVMQGCFGYVTDGRPAHTAFCLFMLPKGQPQGSSGVQFQPCEDGQFADWQD
jgi:hypothetical protein